MSRFLPRDLKNIIFSYFTLPVLQEWYEAKPNFPFYQLIWNMHGQEATRPFNEAEKEIIALSLKPNTNYDKLKFKILTPFELYVHQQLVNGEVGYNGHLYLPMEYMLMSAIQNNDKFFTPYYFDRSLAEIIRFHDIFLYLALKAGADDEILAFLISRGCRKLIGNLPVNQFLKGKIVRKSPLALSTKETAPGYNFVKGLTTLDLPLIQANVNSQGEFPAFVPREFLDALNEIYTLENHQTVTQLRSYLPDKFKTNNYLAGYLFLLDILLGKPITLGSHDINSLFNEVDGLNPVARTLALSVLNGGAYNRLEESDIEITTEYYNTLYSEILYNPKFIYESAFRPKIIDTALVSAWIANQKQYSYLPIPVVQRYSLIQNNIKKHMVTDQDIADAIKVKTLPGDKSTASLISAIRERRFYALLAQVEDMETAVWLANKIDYKYFESQYISLVPNTYTNYINMLAAGFDSSLISANVESLKRDYDKMQNKFKQSYP